MAVREIKQDLSSDPRWRLEAVRAPQIKEAALREAVAGLRQTALFKKAARALWRATLETEPLWRCFFPPYKFEVSYSKTLSPREKSEAKGILLGP